MDFLEFSRKRYSDRSYSSKPVEQNRIDKILNLDEKWKIVSKVFEQF